MIKVDKHMVKMEGSEPLLAAELSFAIKSFFNAMTEAHGEALAKEKVEFCYKRAVEPVPEDDEVKEMIQEILEDILSAIKGEKKEGEK